MAFRIKVEECLLLILLAQRKLLSDFCDDSEVISPGVTRRRRKMFKLKRKVALGSFYELFVNMINFFSRHMATWMIDDGDFKINKVVQQFETTLLQSQFSIFRVCLLQLPHVYELCKCKIVEINFIDFFIGSGSLCVKFTKDGSDAYSFSAKAALASFYWKL